MDSGETVEEAIEALLDPRVALPSGGQLWIEPTHGMVAVDVDSGRIADANPAAGALLGTTRNALLEADVTQALAWAINSVQARSKFSSPCTVDKISSSLTIPDSPSEQSR